jgi:hypothetical protein
MEYCGSQEAKKKRKRKKTVHQYKLRDVSRLSCLGPNDLLRLAISNDA